jgi:signal transduction histidine kinase
MPALPPYAGDMSSDLRSRIIATIVTGVTLPATPRSPQLRRGRVDLVFVADVLIAIVCWGITWGVLVTQNTRHHSPHNVGLLFLLSVVLCAPLALRTFYPLAAWSICALALLWAGQFVPPYSPGDALTVPAAVVVYVLCLYAVAVRCKPWVVAAAALVTVIGARVVETQFITSAVAVAAVPVAVGIIVRTRRGNREQIEVVERRHEGQRALLEERQRIARELHDVVAHHMSVIAIQAEAGPYRSANPPPELVESFGEIRASALSGLKELRRVLGVLRSDQQDTAPQPGLEDLPGLLDSARAGGVSVSTEVTGAPRAVPEGVNLSAYRIVQEALSNAMRHAPGSTVQVKLFYGEAALVIEVRNNQNGNGGPPAARADGPAGRVDGQAGRAAGPGGRAAGPGREPWAELGSGHGIIGMRERAAMLGGHLEARPVPSGEFLVTAALPLGEGDGGEAA